MISVKRLGRHRSGNLNKLKKKNKSGLLDIKKQKNKKFCRTFLNVSSWIIEHVPGNLTNTPTFL